MRTHELVKTIFSAKKLKTAITIFGGILICNDVDAQGFSTTGSSTTTMNNVGIGTTSPPGSKLYVVSGYSQSGSTWIGQPALKLDWNMPGVLSSPFPSASPPNAIEILGISSWGPGSSSISPFMCMNSQGNLGIKAWPAAGFALNVEGATKLTGNLQVGNIALPSGTRMVVDGDIAIKKSNSSDWRNLTAHTTDGVLNLAVNTGSSNGSNIELCGANASGRKGEVRIISYGPEASGGGVQFWNFDPNTTTWKAHMRVLSSGKVYIGDQQPDGDFKDYKLGVDGDIVCKRAVVQTNSWADFVFEPGYDLPELEEVEQYINTNKHLPGVPTEKIVLEKGIDVGDMNKILLQKVEELTLYMIEMKKENQELKNSIQKLQKQ